MFNERTVKDAKHRMMEEALYQQVAEEMEKGDKRVGLWAKAIAVSEGDGEKANALYIGYRVQSLIDEALIADEENRLEREQLEAERIEFEKKHQEEVGKQKAKKKKGLTSRESAEIVLDCRDILTNKGYKMNKKGYGWIVIDLQGKVTEITDVEILKQYTERI